MDPKMLKSVGSVLMGVGFLWGSFLTVKYPSMVEWTPYGIAAVITAIGAGVLLYSKLQSGAE